MNFYTCEILSQKKNKKFKTGLMTSFILLITWNWYIKVCNYYSILPELKLIDLSWICDCFPRKFVLNELLRSRVWIQPVFSSEFLSRLAILFASCFKVFGRLNDTASVASWACFTVYQCNYFLTLKMSDKEELSKMRGSHEVYRRRMESLETEIFKTRNIEISYVLIKRNTKVRSTK